MTQALRMRVFAGPNGSGKSTIKSILAPHLLGHYLNADELEAHLRLHPFFDFQPFNLPLPDEGTFRRFFEEHPLSAKINRTEAFSRLRLTEKRADFSELNTDSYLASILSDWLRRALLATRQSFTFETVMSSPDKLDVFRRAREAGYRTYLYYVATKDPAINVARVAQRVALAGHPVPEDKIYSRYYRSLELLLDAIRLTDRAYVFDNSVANASGKSVWIAEITNGRELELKIDLIPAWFDTHVLSKIIPNDNDW